MLCATCPGVIYGYIQRGTSYWRLRYIEDKCSRICLIDLTSFTSRYCFVRTLHREYAWWSRGEEVSPTSTSYCADILFTGYSFWWRLLQFAEPKHEVWQGEGDVKFRNPSPWLILYHPSSCHIQIFVAILLRVFAIYEGDWPMMRKSLWLAIYSKGIRSWWRLAHLTKSLFEILSALCSHHILNFAIISRRVC